MATAFSKLQKAGFSGIQYPVRRMSVRGSLRYHVHEYPHAAGGAFENLERKLYEVRMTCPFMQRFPGYPDLWPGRLSQLRRIFETGAAGALVIPTIGTIQARCVSWPEEMDAKIQSGVMVDLEFLEDQSQLSLVDSLIEAATSNVQTLAEQYGNQLKKYRDDNPNSLSAASVLAAANPTSGFRPDVLDLVSSVANEVFSLKDQVEFQGQLLEAKVRRLDAIIREADATVVALQHPDNYPLLGAIRDLWQSNKQLANDIQGQRSALQIFAVPVTMSVGDISVRLYGDNSHAVELMQINPFDDVLAIPAGTMVKYYPPDAAAA